MPKQIQHQQPIQVAMAPSNLATSYGHTARKSTLGLAEPSHSPPRVRVRSEQPDKMKTTCEESKAPVRFTMSCWIIFGARCRWQSRAHGNQHRSWRTAMICALMTVFFSNFSCPKLGLLAPGRGVPSWLLRSSKPSWCLLHQTTSSVL